MQQNPPLFQNRGLTASLPGVKTNSGQIIALTSHFFTWLQPELSARGVHVSKQKRGLYTWSSPAGNAVDMSREAIITKLMLLLPHLPEGDSDALRGSFHMPLCDEIGTDS